MSDEESEDENRSKFKLSKTHQLINQLEHKLSILDQKNAPNLYPISRDSHLKSKQELERELQQFEQRMRKLNQSENSQLHSSQAKSIPKQSPQKLNLSNPILQLLTQKLESFDEDKNTMLTSKQDHFHREQQILEQEQNNLLREQQQAKFELESLLRGLEIEEQRKLNEQKISILKEQEEKLFDIQEQSEKLIQEEEEKKTNFLLELQQLSFEKNQLQAQLQNFAREQGMLISNRDEISNQLNTLMQLHNQILQNDLKKKVVHLDASPLQNLYQMNQQIQESMNQQLSLIRQELNEQKQINLDLLQVLSGEQQQTHRQIVSTEMQQQLEQQQQLQQQSNSQIQFQNNTCQNLNENLESEESNIMFQKYNNQNANLYIQKDFNQLFEKHKKQLFKPKQKLYLKQNKATVEKRKRSIDAAQSKSKSKSKEKENFILKDKEKKKTPLSFEETYKRHIQDQLKKLNFIVEKSLNNK
ncbi:unnamed protein product (macronuclear) [Paramecium tetraurelia]|uniref:Uncharacterized protein n=1 Tax=Paramecium tetraurelia TaxID=5888 RepID=A0CBL5_PARTE|nr:uncharacterized protein GSPATT00036965001 [Paramecium tetraurelia]CAK68182.1 unnamed protein product [Paramecium tetraurelia]|eukprot:XP_001435579.1 hypothetical protein (macronuclear) [Paramecium tetraurelia strain d4-2]